MAATGGWALTLGRVIAAGRIAAGLALLLAPGRTSRAWVGDHGPAGEALTRCVGIRDLVMGGIALHTVDHPQVGPRWVATCALADAVDAGASYAARRALPPSAPSGSRSVRPPRPPPGSRRPWRCASARRARSRPPRSRS